MPDTLIGGRYRLDELLGRGGMSEVWCATDAELGRRVAIKLLAPEADHARFEREAKAVASLGHPNITQLYDYGEEGDRPYMVLEYLSGGTLEDRLREHDGPLPDEQATGIAAQVAAGLAHAHGRGVVHRDLKPANVLFDDEGRAKIADFGIARMAAGEGTLTEAGTVLGTAAYISPEQASGEPATAASDVYSFGVILYRMLTGRLPFVSNDPMELVMLHRDAPPPPLADFRSGAPPQLESAAMASLAKRPQDRPRDGSALLAALGVTAGAAGLTAATTALAADEGATRVLDVPPAAAARAARPPARPPARNRAPLLIAGLAALALAGIGVAYAMTRDSSAGPPTSTLPPLTFGHSTASTTGSTTTGQSTTTGSTTTASTTAPTTTAPPATTQLTTTIRTTTAPPPTTTAPPPPPTTAPPPTTTAPPPTTTAPTTPGP